MIIQSCLNSFTPYQLNRFRKFVSSPYFNQDYKIRDLLEYLLSGIEDRQQLDHLIFPEKNYSYARITNLISDLKELLEKFLAIEACKQDGFTLPYKALSAPETQRIPKLFHQISRRLDKQSKDLGFYSEHHFLEQYLVEDTRNTFFIGSGKRSNDKSLELKIAALDNFYLAAKLKSICQLINRQNVILMEDALIQHHTFIQNIRERQDTFQKFPLIDMYAKILLTLVEGEDESHYFKLKQLLQDNLNVIPDEELKPMFQYAQNYCIKQANKGRTTYLSELFYLYQRMLEEGLIFYQGYISPSDVKNIVALGVRLKAYDWTEQFLKEYADKIDPEHKSNTLMYNQAFFLHHGKGDSRQAMKLLNQADFNDVYFYLGARTLLMKIYYELYEDEALHALLHTFSKSLKRNKHVSAYKRDVFQNLIRFVKKLSVLRTRKITMSKSSFRKVLEQHKSHLQASRDIPNITWLVAKLDELDSGH